MKRIKLVIVGCGFWSKYQSFAWKELSESVKIVAFCDKNIEKARKLAQLFGVSKVYDDLAVLLEREDVDLVDIISDVDSHAPLVKICADHQVSMVCQKPMGPSFEVAEEMVGYCRDRGTDFFVHENFRWQHPIRRVKELLNENRIGAPFKASIRFCSSFPVFKNQPSLADLKQFIITDVGAHILDISRFLFGEAHSQYCQTHRINPIIKGEDVANVFIRHRSGVHSYCEMSYASRFEKEYFPQTLIVVEGALGSVSLEPGYKISCTTADGTIFFDASPPMYEWSDPDYAIVHSSMVACHQNILQAKLHKTKAETCGEDNLKTIRLIFDAYRSAERNQVISYD
jgi:D-apiose dehydrogenase